MNHNPPGQEYVNTVFERLRDRHQPIRSWSQARKRFWSLKRDYVVFNNGSQVIRMRRKEDMKTGNLSRERLDRLHHCMTGYVERGEVPGIVTLVSRHGEIHVDAVGNKSLDGPDPVRYDTIFRIA